GLPVASLYARPVVVGQLFFQRQNGVGAFARVVNAGALEGGGDVVAIGLALFRGRRLVAGVVVLVGQAQAALAHVGQVAFGLALVLGDQSGHDGCGAGAAERAGGLFVRIDGQQLVERLLNGADTQFLEPFGVHVAIVKAGNLVGRCAGLGMVAIQLMNDGVHAIFGFNGQLGKRAPAGKAGRDVAAVQPALVDPGEKVVAGLDGVADIGGFYAPVAQVGLVVVGAVFGVDRGAGSGCQGHGSSRVFKSFHQTSFQLSVPDGCVQAAHGGRPR